MIEVAQVLFGPVDIFEVLMETELKALWIQGDKESS